MALPEWIMTFLLSTLLPWVIQLMAAAVDKYLRPYTTVEGFTALAAIFQKFFDDALAANRESVKFFIVGVIAPIFKIEIITPEVVDPLVVSNTALHLLADVAEEINSEAVFAPYVDENTGTVITPN